MILLPTSVTTKILFGGCLNSLVGFRFSTIYTARRASLHSIQPLERDKRLPFATTAKLPIAAAKDTILAGSGTVLAKTLPLPAVFPKRARQAL